MGTSKDVPSLPGQEPLPGQQPPGAYPIHHRPPVGIRLGRRGGPGQRQQQQRHTGLRLAPGDANDVGTSTLPQPPEAPDSLAGGTRPFFGGGITERTEVSTVVAEPVVLAFPQRSLSSRVRERVSNILWETLAFNFERENNNHNAENDHPPSLSENRQIYAAGNSDEVVEGDESSDHVQQTNGTTSRKKKKKKNSNQRQRSQQNEQRKNMILVILVGFILMIVLAVAVPVTMATITSSSRGKSSSDDDTSAKRRDDDNNTGNDKNENDSIAAGETTTQTPTSTPTFLVTESPTTLTPTKNTPTNLPTHNTTPRFMNFLQILYPISGEALYDKTSDQFEAFHWLVFEDEFIDDDDLMTRNNENDNDPTTTTTQKLIARYILAVLYFATTSTISRDDQEWNNKLNFLNSTADVCEWNDMIIDKNTNFPENVGVNCSTLDGTPTGLILPSLGLFGTIPSEIGHLTSLQHMRIVNNNRLDGMLPADLARLSNLITLDLHGQVLKGTIPAALSDLTNLEYLDLSYNFFSGTIPSKLGNLTKLQYLFLNTNDLSGTIPDSFRNIGQVSNQPNDASKSVAIRLYDNDITGNATCIFCPLDEEPIFEEVWLDCDAVYCDCCTCI